MTLDPQTSFVCYSTPGTSDYELIRGKVSEIDLGNLPVDPGFIFSKFNNDGKAYFLSSISTLTNPDFDFKAPDTHAVDSMNRKEYTSLCKDFIHACHSEFEKLILSRIKTVPMSKSAGSLFHGFRKAYPNAFVYLLHSPEIGTWLGATPEVFLFRKGQQYATMSLAGTQGITDEQYTWLEKEKHEQLLVTDFITNELSSLGINATIDGPETAVAGNVAHLCTEFSFESVVERERIVKALHPTPAVCGLPRKKARTKILDAEPHDRELYCGFLGPVNIADTDQLFVNLRCLKADQEHIHLFVGGGITSDSDADMEWLETEMKAQTLLGVIEKL